MGELNEWRGVLAADVLAGLSGIVTGAGSGIGRAIALRMVALGANVLGVGRRIDALEETARLATDLSGRFGFESCNVRDAVAVDALVRKTGEEHGIDILVNNAGGQFSSPASELSRRGWDAVIDLNLNAVFTITRAAYPYLARRGGSVINISLSQVERGSPGIVHSIAARAGVLGLTRTLALEWAPERIRVNCIGPGTVSTEGLAGNYRDTLVTRLKDSSPLGRDTSTSEVAELAAFLASRAGQLMTGQLIHIDGGAHIGPGLSMLEDAGS